MYKKNGKITKGRAVIAKRFLACLLTVVLCMDLNITTAEAYGEDGTGDALGTISMLSDGLTKNSTVQMVAMGWCYTAMVTKNGELYCCGYNYHGELGNGTTEEQLTSVKVFDNVVYVTSSGTFHNAAVTRDGGLYCWGSNYYAQIGNGTTKEQLTPAKVMEI